MADTARIKRNIGKMLSMGASEAEVDEYVASEGVTPELLRGEASAAAPSLSTPDPKRSRSDSAIAGALDTATFGLVDELAAGIEWGANKILPSGDGRTYEDALKKVRGELSDAKESNPGFYLGGQIAGGLGQGAGLARAGLLAGTNALRAGQGLGRVAVASARDGAIIGGAQGAGSGEGVAGRLAGATAGAAGGGLIGAAAPFAISGASAAARGVAAPVMARLRPESYYKAALGETVRRSGRSVQDIASDLLAARRDGQGMFTVADALGNPGQRVLSTVARTPNDARMDVIEALSQRQMGQGERLSSALAEGFDATDTAAQRTASLTSQRASDAARNYGAARAGSRPVDPSGAILAADDFLRPGPVGQLNLGTNIADDSIEGAVRRARSYLTDGRSVLSDFDAAFRAKREMDAMIERAAPSVQRQLIPIRNALDDALADASPQYASARDTFRQQSQVIDAVDMGRDAASPRRRAADTTQQFSALRPDQQQAFRAGYADPLIGRVESASISPTTNKARMLMTEKSGREFPAFAAPGRGEQLGNRIAREQRMFETSNAAMGGSKTADNLADAADMANFDPSVIRNLIQGNVKQAAVDAVIRAINEAKGTPPQVLQRLAKTLMETDPQVAQEMLRNGLRQIQNSSDRKAMGNALMISISAAAGGRAAQ